MCIRVEAICVSVLFRAFRYLARERFDAEGVWQKRRCLVLQEPVISVRDEGTIRLSNMDEQILLAWIAICGCILLFGGWHMAKHYSESSIESVHKKTMFGQVVAGVVGLSIFHYFCVVIIVSDNITSLSDLDRPLWAVADAMAKGVFFDLFESFEISLGHIEVPKRNIFVFQFITFVFRTLYSLAGGIILFEIWRTLSSRYR